jgi:hypothetical protein
MLGAWKSPKRSIVARCNQGTVDLRCSSRGFRQVEDIGYPEIAERFSSCIRGFSLAALGRNAVIAKK